MHDTKAELIRRNGLRCMLCGKTFSYRQIQWHHVKPKYVSKLEGEQPDNSYFNGALLCLKCHALVHEYLWWQDEYQMLMDMILENKKPASN